MTFTPKFQITATISKSLMIVEANKEVVNSLPITPKILALLRESAKLITTHYSTMIEGNKLNEKEIIKVVKSKSVSKIKPKQRDEKEVLGYYAALEHVHQIADKNLLLNEKIIQTIHAIVMSLDLFLKQKIITTKDVALLFGLGIRAANNICNKWLELGFLEASSEAKKNRGYFLAKKWRKLVE